MEKLFLPRLYFAWLSGSAFFISRVKYAIEILVDLVFCHCMGVKACWCNVRTGLLLSVVYVGYIYG